MKNIIIMLVLMLFYDSAISKKDNYIRHDPFMAFYPHLGNTVCKQKAYQLLINTAIPGNKKIELWKNYEQECSKDGSYQLILSDFYLSFERRYDEVKKILENIIINANYDLRYHKLLLHTVYRYLNEKDKSINLAMTMINDYPGWYGGYSSLGDNYFDIKDWSNSKKHFEKSILLNDQDPYSYLMLSSISYELKEDDKVSKYYHQAFLLDPIKPFLDRRSSAANVVILVNKGDFKEAKNILDTQQEIDPDVCNEERFQRVKKYYEDQLSLKK